MPDQPRLSHIRPTEEPSTPSAAGPRGWGVVALFVLGTLLVLAGGATEAFRESAWVAERLERLSRVGVAPGTLRAVGLSSFLLAFGLHCLRRTEERLRAALGSTGPDATLLTLVPDLLARLSEVQAEIEVIRPSLGTIEDRSIRLGDGISETYRVTEGIRKANDAWIEEARAALQELRRGVEATRKTVLRDRRANEERREDSAHAQDQRLAAIANRLGEVDRAVKGTEEVRDAVVRLERSLRAALGTPAPSAAPRPARAEAEPPPPRRAAPPDPTVETTPSPSPQESSPKSAEFLSAVERLKSVRKGFSGPSGSGR